MLIELFYRDRILSPDRQISRYTIDKIIGEGRYGICYLVHDGQKQYILKQLKRGMLKKSKAKAGYEEEILMSTQHERIPRFIEKISGRDFYGYVLEYKAGKTLEEVICDEGYVFTPEEIYRIGLQVIDIMKYLHGKNIVHRDIRVPNTLYDNGQLYLLDFGLARWVDRDRYTVDVDFSYFGDFLLHLHYTAFELEDGTSKAGIFQYGVKYFRQLFSKRKSDKKKVWHEELDLSPQATMFLKRLMGLAQRYKNIDEVEKDFKLSHSRQNYSSPPPPQ
ncbi:MAG: Serine/threonine-protein kinase PrkC [Pelotomaculum sp. PtaB.Bin104]|nr:MAG: Serine/threonine-protein kinase PrkC [Pelotomaculum sp. PtaB.Bin104]